MALTITVPATTANLGPGFDCLGAALTLYNRFTFTRLEAGAPQPQLEVIRSGKASDGETLVLDGDNLLWRSIQRFYQEIQQDIPPMHIAIEMGVPLARGLGSSATAIVGGLLGANALAGNLLNAAQIGALATELEGHPDNVIPAQLGGCRLAATGLVTPEDPNPWQFCELPWHPDLVPVVAIPDFELSTEAARQVLPATYSRADAVFNAAHVGLLLQALATGNGDWLRSALQDRIHQPYRQSLIPGFTTVQAAAVAAGAYGVVISGAGPTLLAIAPTGSAATVAEAMATAWTTDQPHIQVKALVLDLDRQGAQLTPH